MTGQNYKDALRHWTIGIQYLHLVESVAEKTSETGNRFVVISDDKITPEEYRQETRWADHALVIPLLFDFYHGIEVLLKGFLIAKGQSLIGSHRLSRFLADFNSQYPSNELNLIIEQYIQAGKLVSPLDEFCQRSNISIDDYYQALKYPESMAGSAYEHTPLKYKGQQGVQFFKGLVRDIRDLRRKAVSLGRSVCPFA
ncbi:MAG: hypothetical protein R3F37_15905 [Candidatus Competibacteraceae bacterium]